MGLELVETGKEFLPVLPEGLVGCWKMDELAWDGSADEVKDISGKGNHGVAVNGLTTISGGKFGRCTDMLAASSQYLDCGNDASLTTDLNAFTIAAWVKGVFGERTPLVSLSTLYSIMVSVNWLFGRAYIFMGATNIKTFTIPANLTDGNDHRMVFTVPGSAQEDINNAEIYVDGNALAVGSITDSGPQQAKNSFRIGRFGSYYYDHIVDELAVYNLAWGQAEATADYNGGLGRELIKPVSYALPLEAVDIRPVLEVVEV